MKFRERPPEVEAMQLFRSEEMVVRDWIERNGKECMSWRPKADGGFAGLLVSTPDGYVEVPWGDWIVRRHGELYPCSHDDFVATYEPVPEGEG